VQRLEPIYVVYGNHGRSPAQLEDYHEYLTQAFESLGYAATFSEEIVGGRLNILMEYFSAYDVHKIREAHKIPGTRLICIATEFITDQTFNDFGINVTRKATKVKFNLPLWAEVLGRAVLPVIFPSVLRAFAISLMPGKYFAWKRRYYALFGYPQRSPYAFKNYWLDRFRSFNQLEPLFESIWCVTPHQLDEYFHWFGREKVKLMPMASWNRGVQNLAQNFAEKDVDFLFTGSLTPYREAVFGELKKLGYSVMVGPATWPSYMRDHYIARTKVCLQVRQDPNWRYPSVMRYHYLLCSGSVVVGEQTDEKCIQEDFIYSVPPEKFVDTCVQILKEGDFVSKGAVGCHRYYDACHESRSEFAGLLPSTLKVQNERVLEPSVSSH